MSKNYSIHLTFGWICYTHTLARGGNRDSLVCVPYVCVCLYRVVCSWCVVVDTHTLSPTKFREKIGSPLNGTHTCTRIMRTHARTHTYTGTLVCIIAPTHARTGAWVSEMRAVRKLKNCGNCSILTPTPHLHPIYTHLPTTIPNPLKTS
jgi:hypothetical protein